MFMETNSEDPNEGSVHPVLGTSSEHMAWLVLKKNDQEFVHQVA